MAHRDIVYPIRFSLWASDLGSRYLRFVGIWVRVTERPKMPRGRTLRSQDTVQPKGRGFCPTAKRKGSMSWGRHPGYLCVYLISVRNPL